MLRWVTEPHRSPLVLVTLGLGALTGCDHDLQIEPEWDAGTIATNQELARSAAAREIARSVAGRKARGAEDDILRLEAQVRGIGGAYLERESGKLIVLSVDPAMDARAKDAAETMLQSLSIQEDASSVEVRRARYAFSDLVGWKTILLRELINLPDFISIDADERSNRIVVRIASEDARAPVLHGVQVAGLELEAVTVVAGTRPEFLTSIRDEIRPMGGGLEIDRFPSNPGVGHCTAGWPVTTNQGEEGFLTAAHCMNWGGGGTGGGFTQPENGGYVGAVTLSPSWNLSGCVDPDTQLPWSGECTRADAAFVESSQAVKRIALTQSVGTSNSAGSLQLSQMWGDIGDSPSVWIGMLVDKVGRTTGWTRGSLEQTCEDVKVQEPGGTRLVVVLCAFHVETARAESGDSGSPVFKAFSNSDLRPLGILFGGGCQPGQDCVFYFNDFYSIRLHLGRTFDPESHAPPVAVSISGPSSVYPGTNCTWSAIRTGGDSPYSFEWSGVLTGTQSQVSGAISSTGWLRVAVSDDAMGFATDSLVVSRTSSNPECGGGGGGGPEEVVGLPGR